MVGPETTKTPKTATERAGDHLEEIAILIEDIKNKMFVISEQQTFNWSDVEALSVVRSQLNNTKEFINA